VAKEISTIKSNITNLLSALNAEIIEAEKQDVKVLIEGYFDTVNRQENNTDERKISLSQFYKLQEIYKRIEY